MNSEQAGQFLMDYGPIIWFVFLTIALITAIVKAWPFISNVVKTVDIITGLPVELRYIHEKLDTLEIMIISVEIEVMTHGGSSIKDVVQRIEDRLDNI